MGDLKENVRDDAGFAELEKLRQAFNISQKAVCERMQCNPASYSRWRLWAGGDRKRGQRPNDASMALLRRVMEEIIRERISAMGAALSSG